LKFAHITCIVGVFIVLLLPLHAGATAESTEKHLSLDDCISIALENASSLKKAENALQLQ